MIRMRITMEKDLPLNGGGKRRGEEDICSWTDSHNEEYSTISRVEALELKERSV